MAIYFIMSRIALALPCACYNAKIDLVREMEVVQVPFIHSGMCLAILKGGGVELLVN